MIENSLIMLWIKHSINNMANEQFEFKLTSFMNILGDILMRFSKDVTYNQSIGLLKVTEILSLRIKLSDFHLKYLKFA
jgi:hypothetical protein